MNAIEQAKQEGKQAWADSRMNAINPYPINSALSVAWWHAYDKALHEALYGPYIPFQGIK